MQAFLLILILWNMLNAESNDLLTYIIPAYNCESYIEQAVDSIYNQHLDIPFEIVCTDDASTDQTLEVLNRLASIHPELKVCKHSINRGGGAARNTCVTNSSGNMIFCLDSDNVLIEDSIQSLIDEFRKGEFDIICFEQIYRFRDDLNVIENITYKIPNKTITFRDIFESDLFFPGWSGNYLFSRKSYLAAGGYEEEYRSLDTFTFGFKQLLNGFRMTYVDGAYYHRIGIPSYYIRDMNEGRFNANFCLFLSKYDYIFNAEMKKKLQNCLKKIKRGQSVPPMETIFMNQKSVLDPSFR